MAEVKELHFGVGEQLGELLTNIGREHLTCNYDLSKSLLVFVESLHMPVHMVFGVLTGDIVLVANTEDNSINAMSREAYQNEYGNDYPIEKFDIPKWLKEQYIEIEHTAKKLFTVLKSYDYFSNKLEKKGQKYIAIDWHAIISFLNDENVDGIVESIKSDDEIYNMISIIRIVRSFLEKSYKFEKLLTTILLYSKEISYITKNSESKLDFSPYHKLPPKVIKLQTLLNTFLSTEVFYDKSYELTEDEKLDEYILNQKIIDEELSKGIKPVNILENYSAGWLSPDGDYYGLNGDIANLLHNQIADALFEIGVIPNTEENKDNPDYWLSNNGWIKIHGDWILYDGYFSEPEIPITKKQIEALTKYGQTCHKGKLRLGTTQKPISAA